MASDDERPSRVHKTSHSFKLAARRLGLRVRQLRQQRGLTLQKAAEAMVLDLTHLQKIEAGRLNITLVTLDRLAIGLGCSIADLFSDGSLRKRLGEGSRIEGVHPRRARSSRGGRGSI